MCCFSPFPQTFHLHSFCYNTSFIFLAVLYVLYGQHFLSAYRLSGANISHCLGLCAPVTISGITDHLCGPTRDCSRIRTWIWICRVCENVKQMPYSTLILFTFKLRILGSFDPVHNWPIVNLNLPSVYLGLILCTDSISTVTLRAVMLFAYCVPLTASVSHCH